MTRGTSETSTAGPLVDGTPAVPADKMAGTVAIQDLEFHGRCTDVGVLLLSEDEAGGRCAVLAISDHDRLLHIPARPYTRNEGLAACAARALSDWTSGALAVRPDRLSETDLLCVGTRIYFLCHIAGSQLAPGMEAARRNAARDGLRGIRDPALPGLPRGLRPVPIFLGPDATQERSSAGEHLSPLAALAIGRYAESLLGTGGRGDPAPSHTAIPSADEKRYVW